MLDLDKWEAVGLTWKSPLLQRVDYPEDTRVLQGGWAIRGYKRTDVLPFRLHIARCGLFALGELFVKKIWSIR